MNGVDWRAGRCSVPQMEVVNFLFCLPGFLIRLQFIIFSSLLFLKENLIYLSFIYLFHGSNPGKRRQRRRL